ncbi:MAG: glycosyltransferase family 2 protein [Paracoccaceae bacterium]
MPEPAVLTIILNFRTPELTLGAIQAALREMRDLNSEVLVIDNGSEDGSFEALLKSASERGWLNDGVLRIEASPQNGGFGAGMNIGFAARMSDGRAPDFFYLLNSDATPAPGAVGALVSHMQSHPDAGFAGSFLHGPDGEAHQTAFRFPSISSEFETAASTGVISRLLERSIVALDIPDHTVCVDWTAGASLMVRAQTLHDIGGFDEAFFLYFEETDLCRRAANVGWKTYYVPQSQVTHIGSVSTGMKKWDRTPTYWFDSRLHYFTKSHGRSYAGVATFARVTGGLIWQLRRLVQRKPANDPAYFLRDLSKHYMASLFRASPHPQSAAPFAKPASEEPK